MSDLALLLATKGRELRNRARQFHRHSRLKLAVILVFGTGVWVGLHRLFTRGFYFLRLHSGGPDFAQFLMQNMLALFFFALLVMLVFSNGIILFGGLYRSRETAFLVARPVRPVSLVLYRLLESVGFSSWAFLFLVTPLLVAYAGDQRLGPVFYLQALAFLVVFLFIPAGAGALVTMGLAAFFPRSKRAVMIAIGGVIVVALAWLGVELADIRHQLGPGQEPSAFLLFEKIHFILHPLMPSYWVSEGITNLGTGDPARSALFFRLTLSNALFLVLLVIAAARTIYLRGWWAGPGYRASRRLREGPVWRRVIPALLAPLGAQVRPLVIKDLKTFLRDPIQWSQFLIFFGLLAIYFANLRTFQYHHRMSFWKNIIAQLNLAATCLTLSTFTSRFVFPQLSLEGRRFWILGMAPMPRRQILVGKFCFAALGALAVSLSLVLLSSWMLEVPRRVVALQVVGISGICLGLSGMSVGLGALYPDFQEDNPSKIVSGFGGTLNLVLSLLLVGVVLMLEAAPCTLFMTGRMTADAFLPAAALASAGILAVCGLAAVLPLWLGLRAFERREV
jgi:ABC-2 type transport system permease protein